MLKTSQNEEITNYINDLQETVDNYDGTIKTGCRALDITITEMKSAFNSHKIYFTYSADGALLNFFQDTEIYSLFGNILKNAFNACLKEKDKDKRTIPLSIIKKANQVYIHEDNVSSLDVTFDNRLPKTSQDESIHGFGTKSIEYLVKKYNGIVKFSKNENRFSVDILIPIQD